MDQKSLENALAKLPLRNIRYYERIGSTNDEASRWIAAGAPDFSVLVADEQTQGRGRGSRKWFTYPGSALAFSVILRATPQEQAAGAIAARFAGLGALSVCLTLQQGYQLAAQIKWPNDVLIDGQKCCGILAETEWLGNDLSTVILGIGINIAPGSVPPAEILRFPATCLETAAAKPIQRVQLLAAVLANLQKWRAQLMSRALIQQWEENLAYRGEIVQIQSAQPEGHNPVLAEGRLIGLDSLGRLKLASGAAPIRYIEQGEIHLRKKGRN